MRELLSQRAALITGAFPTRTRVSGVPCTLTEQGERRQESGVCTPQPPHAQEEEEEEESLLLLALGLKTEPSLPYLVLGEEEEAPRPSLKSLPGIFPTTALRWCTSPDFWLRMSETQFRLV